MPRFFAVLLALAGITGCATTQEPGWLAELRAREAEPLPAQTVDSPDRSFRVRVPAKLARSVQPEGEAYNVSLDVGTTAPIDCWVHPDALDFAASIASLSETTFTAIGQRFGEIDAREVGRVDAGVIGRHPFLAVDWMYRVQTERGPQVGQVKHLVASADGRGLYCQQNEVGYAETFRRVVGAMVTSLEFRESSGPAPYFTEVATMSIQGMQVGVQHTTLTLDADRDTRIDTWTSLLIPVTGDTLRASDSFEVEFSRPDGTLINQVHVESENGEVVTHLELNPQPDGGWGVDGTFQGRPLSTRIESASPLSSWLGDALTLRGALADGGPGTEVTTTRWVPNADPTRLLDGTLSIQRQIGPERFAARFDTEGLEGELVVDRQGGVAAGSMSLGAAEMEFERVYTGGSF